MQSYLDFEKPVADLEGKIAELKSLSGDARAVSIDDEINGLTARADQASSLAKARELNTAKARELSLASRGRHCQLPGHWANQAASATRSTGDICRLEASPTAPMACAARRPASATSSPKTTRL